MEVELLSGADFVGGEFGGVVRLFPGALPGEQTGMCLFGMGAGVPRREVLSVR